MHLQSKARTRSVRLSLALAGVALASTASAQDGYFGPEDDTGSATDCAPPCRPGYACVDGACTSPCNPPCTGVEVCSRNGKCIPRAPVAEPATRPAAPTATSGWTTSSHTQPTAPAFDQELYNSYKRKREGGGAAMAVGVLMICAAVGMGFASGLTGNETLLWVAIGVEILGDLFFFPGLGSWIKGKRGMERMEKSMARSGPRRDGLHLEGVGPLVARSDRLSGGGLALNFAF